MPATEESSPVARLLSAGAELAGTGAGAAIGLFGGPIGAVGGAVAGHLLGLVASDFATRMLSHREQVRVGAVIEFAASAIAAREVLGEVVRDDGFFDGDRSSAQEVAEGVLIAAKNEHEENKIKYLGNLLASIACSDLDVSTANFAVSQAERLSWLDTQILAVFQGGKVKYPMPSFALGEATMTSWFDWTVSRALVSLTTSERKLVSIPPKPIGPMKLPGFDLSMSALALADGGRLLADLLQLEQVPKSDVLEVYRSMTRAPNGDAVNDDAPTELPAVEPDLPET